MYTVYKLNADELNADFLEVLKTTFRHKDIEIAVTETADIEEDETAYLLRNPANRARLLSSIENIAGKRDLVSVDLDGLG